MTSGWDICRRRFAADGSLRDIYVLDTSQTHWDLFLSFIRAAEFPLALTVDGIATPVPVELRHAAFATLREHSSVVLSISSGGLILCCHFFADGEIELDLDPRAVSSQEALTNLQGFLRGMARAIALPVLLTEENSQDREILRYDPRTDRFSFTS